MKKKSKEFEELEALLNRNELKRFKRDNAYGYLINTQDAKYAPFNRHRAKLYTDCPEHFDLIEELSDVFINCQITTEIIDKIHQLSLIDKAITVQQNGKYLYIFLYDQENTPYSNIKCVSQHLNRYMNALNRLDNLLRV